MKRVLGKAFIKYTTFMSFINMECALTFDTAQYRECGGAILLEVLS